MVGHATHILQDSFAPSHARREGPLLRKIQTVCVYNFASTTICQHNDSLQGDSLELNPEEASAAVRATVGLLISIYHNLPGSIGQSAPDNFLDPRLVRPSDEFSGYVDCELVPTIDTDPASPQLHCLSDVDCPHGRCIAKYCRTYDFCVNDSDCGGKPCIDHNCSQPCLQPSDCKTDQTCSQGACVNF